MEWPNCEHQFEEILPSDYISASESWQVDSSNLFLLGKSTSCSFSRLRSIAQFFHIFHCIFKPLLLGRHCARARTWRRSRNESHLGSGKEARIMEQTTWVCTVVRLTAVWAGPTLAEFAFLHWRATCWWILELRAVMQYLMKLYNLPSQDTI